MQCVCLWRGRGVIKGELWVDGLFLGLNQPVLPNYYTNTIKISCNYMKFHDFAIIFNIVDDNNNVDNNNNIDDN